MTGVPLYRQIYSKYQLGPALHMTHVSNLESIFRTKELRSYSLMRGASYANLANEDVQSGRASIQACGRPLHDFVPLYFGNRTPMVAWNQQRNYDIVFLRFSLDLFAIPDVVISDGNARSSTTRFQPFRGLDSLAFVDRKAISTVKYAHDAELKRKKQAEILVPDRLPLTYLVDIICYSDAARTRVLAITNQYGMTHSVFVRPGSYYFKPKAVQGGQSQ